MMNAKEEILEKLKETDKAVYCAEVYKKTRYEESNRKSTLKV